MSSFTKTKISQSSVECILRRTEGLLEVHQAGHLRCHIVQMSLQSSAHQQGVGQVCDVDANNGKGVSALQHTRLSFFVLGLHFHSSYSLLITTYRARLLFQVQLNEIRRWGLMHAQSTHMFIKFTGFLSVNCHRIMNIQYNIDTFSFNIDTFSFYFFWF